MSNVDAVSGSEERVDVFLRIARPEVGERLPDADQARGDRQLVADADDDAGDAEGLVDLADCWIAFDGGGLADAEST